MITSLDNPRIREVVRLRKGRERRREGVLVAEGVREVERALAAGLALRQLFHAPELLPGWTPEAGAAIAPPEQRAAPAAGRAPAPAAPGKGAGLAREPGQSAGLARDPGQSAPLATSDRPPQDRASSVVLEVSARVLARMAYRAEPEGVLAIFETPARTIPADATLLVVAVGIEKPGNLGAMARTADAAGADALLVGDAECDPWNPNAIRASTGSVFSLPIVPVTADQVAPLPHTKVAAALGADTTYTTPDYTARTAFLVGAEDEGLDAAWQSLADVRVAIPMRQDAAADSLNASTAAALLLYEAVRQRSAT